jgi:hypothetical protein
MVAFSFNAQQFKPNYGGGGSNLPPGKYKGVIVDTSQEKVEKGGAVVGGFLALQLTPIEGPLAGQKHTDRLNLHHVNPKTVEIANEQMSAYCHVTGEYNIVDTAQLHNKPFIFEIGFQKGQEPTTEKPEGGYTEVKAIFDINGNSPGKAGSGPQAQAQPVAQPAAQPPAGVAATSGWGAPAVDTNVAMPAAQPAAQPAAGNGGGWGGPAAQPAAQPAAALPPGWGG